MLGSLWFIPFLGTVSFIVRHQADDKAAHRDTRCLDSQSDIRQAHAYIKEIDTGTDPTATFRQKDCQTSGRHRQTHNGHTEDKAETTNYRQMENRGRKVVNSNSNLFLAKLIQREMICFFSSM